MGVDTSTENNGFVYVASLSLWICLLVSGITDLGPICRAMSIFPCCAEYASIRMHDHKDVAPFLCWLQ